jgi:hypothetical protein
MISFYNCSMIKDCNECNVFCHVLTKIGFLMMGEACKSKICFVMQPLLNPSFCRSTIFE